MKRNNSYKVSFGDVGDRQNLLGCQHLWHRGLEIPLTLGGVSLERILQEVCPKLVLRLPGHEKEALPIPCLGQVGRLPVG